MNITQTLSHREIHSIAKESGADPHGGSYWEFSDHSLSVFAKSITESVRESVVGYLERIAFLEAELNCFKSVGRASQLPGASGFTTACFYAKDVPIDCDVYIKGEQPCN